MPAFGPKQTCRKTQSMSLLGVKRTCRFALHMSAFDPKRTWLGFPCACLSRYDVPPEPWGSNEAARVHHVSRQCSCDVAAYGPRAEGGEDPCGGADPRRIAGYLGALCGRIPQWPQ